LSSLYSQTLEPPICSRPSTLQGCPPYGCIDLCNCILAGKQTPGFAGWAALGDAELLGSLGPSQASVDVAGEVPHSQVEIRRRRGVSWAAIGEALGISRQAARERFS
jgi:hypothetical protein